MTDRADKASVADWIAERNARWARERAERDERLRAAGFKLIHCVAYSNPLTNERLVSTWMGEVETIVITNMPDGHLQYGIGCIVVGPDSEVIADAADPVEMARAGSGVVLTVFKGVRPK